MKDLDGVARIIWASQYANNLSASCCGIGGFWIDETMQEPQVE